MCLQSFLNSTYEKWRKQTWWWDIAVNDAVKEKRRLWKIWRNGGSKEDYVLAKKVAKQRVFAANKIY